MTAENPQAQPRWLTRFHGWHLWRRARDHRLLADLRTDLVTR